MQAIGDALKNALKETLHSAVTATEIPMQYSAQVVEIISKLTGHVEDSYQALNIGQHQISNMPIYGAILEEWNDRHEKAVITTVQDALDGAVLLYASNASHNDILAEYKTLKDNPDQSKLENKTLIDIGPGNIKIATAISLLNDYFFEYPNNDPLNIKGYINKYDQLILDLLHTNDLSATVKFTTLMIQKGAQWFEQNAANWDDLSVREKEGLLSYFYNVGEDFLNQKVLEGPANFRVFRQDEKAPGTLIAIEYLANFDAIATTVENHGGTYLDPQPTDNNPVPYVSVSSDNVAEGGTLEFVVRIDGGEPVDHDITFTATTFQGTTSDFENGRSPDYNGVNGIYTIPAGQTQVVVYVPTDHDNEHEATETVELRISDPNGAEVSNGLTIGTIIDNDEKSPTFILENFEIDVARFLDDGDDPRVSYVISHDGDVNLSGVKLRWYATKNGVVDDDAVYLGYESAGTLRVGERDSEGEDLEPLMELSGNWTIVTTAEYSGLDEPIVLRTDEVSLSQPLPEMQSVRLRNEDAVSDDNDLRIDYALHNPTDEDMRGFEIKFYASKSGEFDTDTAIYLDRESGGTLRVNEEDSEGETIQAAADLEAGDWNLYSVAFWDGQDGGVVMSSDEFTVAGNSSSVDLAIDNFRLDDNFLSQGEDLKVRQTSINYGSEDARGTETTYFWSANNHFDIREDVKIDTDGHGTLRAGEHDTNEYERIDYEDIPKGFGYIFALIDADHEFDEGLANEVNNLSDAHAIYVA